MTLKLKIAGAVRCCIALLTTIGAVATAETEGFEGWPVTGAWGTWTNSRGWILVDGSVRDTTWSSPAEGSLAGWLNTYPSYTDSQLRTPLFPKGIGTLIYRAADYNSNDNSFTLSTSTNGVDWTVVETVTTPGERGVWHAYTNVLNLPGPVALRWLKTDQGGRVQYLGLDDIAFTDPPPAALKNLQHTPAAPTTVDSVHILADVELLVAGVSNAALTVHCRFGGAGPFVARPMQLVSNLTYRTVDAIPAGRPGRVEYYVSATFEGWDATVVAPDDGADGPMAYTVTGYVPPVNARALGPCSRRTPLVLTEIMYHPAEAPDSADLEFIELRNTEPVSRDISDFRVSGDVDYVFPEGTEMAPLSYLVVAADPDALRRRYPVSEVFGPFSNRLSNGGGVLRLRNVQDAILLEVDYGDEPPWPVAPDGAGHALVLARPDLGEGDPAAWDAGARIGGTPGWHEPETRSDPIILINEYLAHTDIPLIDYVELFNAGTQAVDLSEWVLSDTTTTNKFRIPDGTTLLPRRHLVFDQDTLGFSLSQHGDEIYLIDTNAGHVVDAIKFDPTANGRATGRFPDGGPRFYELDSLTPGDTNGVPYTDTVVINEIMFHPLSGLEDDEYVELHNRGTVAADVGYWRFVDGIDFMIPPGTVIPAGGYLVVARDRTNLVARYAQLNETNTVGNFSGRLSNRGERLVLARPDDLDLPYDDLVPVDEVTYSDGWARWTDGGGSSLELKDPAADNRLGMNWAGSDETAKAQWCTIEHTGVLTNGNSSVTELHLFYPQAGECLVDDVEVSVEGMGTLLADDFESGISAWEINRGNHVRSELEAGEGYSGSRSFHVRASGKGDTRFHSGHGVWQDMWNRATALLSAHPSRGHVCTIRAKVRWIKGWPYIVFGLEGAWLEAADRMHVPADLGSPGLRNTGYESNAGPAIGEVTHAPVLPAADEPVVVTAEVHDPDGVASVTLAYRIDPLASITTVAMVDDGLGADAFAADGIFSGVIPGQDAGTLCAFTIDATDAAVPAASSHFPPEALPGAFPAECLVRFGESFTSGAIGEYRLWMTEAVRSRWSARHRRSNEPLEITFVYQDYRAIYNAGGRYRGGWRSYGDPVSSGAYAVTLPKTDRLMGAGELRLDAPGQRGGDGTLMRERHALWVAEQVGLPYSYLRFVHTRVNGNSRGIQHEMQVPEHDFVNSHFPDDDDPPIFKFYRDRPLNPDGLNPFVDENGDKMRVSYRWYWRKKKPEVPDDDFSPIYALADALSEQDPDLYLARSAAVMDLEACMGYFALNHIVGNGDSYGWSWPHNMIAYIPCDDLAQFFLYDMDGSFGGSSSSSLFTGGTATTDKMENHPAMRRVMWRHARHAVEGPLQSEANDARLDAWYVAFQANGFNPSSPDGWKSWVAGRRAYLQGQLDSVDAPLEITTNGGDDLQTAQTTLVLTGKAPVKARTLLLNGEICEPAFTSVTEWEVTVGLREGTNLFTVTGVDRLGTPIEGTTDTITVTATAPVPLPDGYLLISEIMYHPAEGDGEFIEVHNTSTTTAFDLHGMRLSGLDFTFGPGHIIEPGGYVVVTPNVSAYQRTYGNAEVIDGICDGSLDNGGETLRLLRPAATGGWHVMDEVTYSDDPPWPTRADGFGPSLQLIDPSQDNNRPGNWHAATTPYTPGAPNAGHAVLPPFPPLWINEIMPTNTGFIADNAGEHEPWLELHNAGVTPVALGPDFRLSNDPVNPGLWAFPSGAVIEAGESLLVWCDGDAHQSTADSIHAGFHLNGASGTVVLARSDPDALRVLDVLSYAGIDPNHSFGSYPDGDPGSRQWFHDPTPGAANSPTSQVVRVFINEWMADNDAFMADPADDDYDDWFELYNGGDAPVALGGYGLSDDPADPFQSVIPGGFWIAARGHLLAWADNEEGQTSVPDALHVGFRLSKDGETIVLTAPDGTRVDQVTFGPQRTDRSEGRSYGVGFGTHEMTPPTPGGENRVLTFTALQGDGVDIELQWLSESGRVYTISRTNVLSSAAWTPIGVVTATAPTASFRDPALPGTPLYYRITLMP